MKKHNDHSFLGTGWSFPPEFDPDMGSIVMVSDEQDIWESLQVILSTAPGERMMFPKFGCGIRKMVFDTVNATFLTQLKELIRFSILHYEPRIILNNVSINGSDANEGLLNIQLDYTIRKTNSRSNMVYPFYLREGTNIASQFLVSSK
jgi:phage baseplate assembly protein W